MKPSSNTLASLQNIRKYSPEELTYKHVGHNRCGGYLIDAYHGERLLMTYDAYYDYKKDEFKLYPAKSHRLDARTPGYHRVLNKYVERGT